MSVENSQRFLEANRVRRERELHERGEAQRELRRNATAETLRHRQALVIEEMLSKDILTAQQYRAGREIDQVFRLISTGLFAKTSDYSREIRGTGHQDWRAGQVTAYHERYIPWRDDQGRLPLRAITRAQLVIEVVVNNYGAFQVSKMFGLGPATAKRVLRESLHRYAEIAGWVDHCGRPYAV